MVEINAVKNFYVYGISTHSPIPYTDINECSTGTSDCQQFCINTNGSYYCDCETGYTLKNDNTSCDGMHCYCIVFIDLYTS